MGKRTDKFMSDITAKLTELRSTKLRIAELGKNLTEAIAARDAAAATVAKYYKKMAWDTQKPKGQREAEMEADTAYKKLDKLWEAEMQKITKIRKEISLKCTAADAAGDAAAKLLAEFGKFVTEKDKAKLLKWQKTSITAAVAFIMAARKTLAAA